MKKAELIELFSDHLRAGDTSDDTKQKYHPNIVAATLDLALEQINSGIILRANRNSSFDPEGLDLLTKTIECQKVECKDGSYGFALPPMQNLPKGHGIRVIAPVNGNGQFYWIDKATLFNVQSLISYKQGIWFSLSGQRVSLHNSKATKVMVIYIPKLMELDDDDEVNFLEGSGAEVFNLGKQLFSGMVQGRGDNHNQGITDR